MAVAARATAPGSSDPEPTFYICQISRSGPFGRIYYTIEVPVDGTETFHRIQWHIPERPEGLSLYVQWDGAPPVNGMLDERSWVFVKFQTAQPVRDKVRIEIRRMPGERYPPEFAYAGQYQRAYRWPGSRLYSVDTQARWGELKAWIKGREVLTFALVKRDGTVVSEDRLDAPTLDSVTTAILEARPEVEAMAADYRHKCEVPGPIIVT